MFCLLHHLYIYVIKCAYSHIVYTKNQQKLLIFLKPKKTRKKPIKPKKPNPYPRKGQTGIGFFLGYTPPPPPPPIVKLLRITDGKCCIYDKVELSGKETLFQLLTLREMTVS